MAKEDKKTINELARKLLEDHEERESDNILRAKNAIQFRIGNQWPEEVRRERENAYQDGGPRPCPVLDKTNQYIRQIVNEERQNKAAIRIRPVDDHADIKTAEIFNGIIRHIEDQSEAVEAYSTAGEHAIDGGFGYWRVLTDYYDDMSFDQDIRIKRISNRFSVALGPHTEVDGSDAMEGLIWEDMPRESFKEEFPKAKEVDFSASEKWADKDCIRVAEYYRCTLEKVKIHQMEDGSVITDEDYKELVSNMELYNDSILLFEDAPMVDIPEPENTRESLVRKIKWYKLTSAEILDEKDVVGRYIPIIKVIGNEVTLADGKAHLSGMIDTMMDPQRLHNYAHAGFIEQVALAPRAPWLAEEEQVEGFEQDYADANRKPISVLKYKMRMEDGHLVPPPQRTPPAGIAMGWQQMLQNTEQGISASVGMYGPSVGDMNGFSNERSGVALIEQKSQGAIGNFHFPDNLARSIQHTGRILLEWIPEYYDTARVIRIIGEDDTPEIVKIDPNLPESVNQEKDEFEREVGQIYNLSVGKYDVTVSTGPSYTAKRQEAADAQMNLLTLKPELTPILGDLVIKNMDWPGADKMAERLSVMLPPELQKLEQEGEIDPRVEAMMQMVEQKTQEIEMKAQELDKWEQRIIAESQIVSNDKVTVNASAKELTSSKKVFMADVKSEMARIELMGEKLTNDIERSTDNLINEIKNKTPEELELPDDQLAVALNNLADYQQQSADAIHQGVTASVERIAEMMSRPRTTKLQFDDNGEPVGTISE